MEPSSIIRSRSIRKRFDTFQLYIVYLGKNSKNDKIVAIKVMNNKELSDPYLQNALKNEVKILKMLKGNMTDKIRCQYLRNRRFFVNSK
jgi:serine/threonine protein kinase